MLGAIDTCNLRDPSGVKTKEVTYVYDAYDRRIDNLVEGLVYGSFTSEDASGDVLWSLADTQPEVVR